MLHYVIVSAVPRNKLLRALRLHHFSKANEGVHFVNVAR